MDTISKYTSSPIHQPVYIKYLLGSSFLNVMCQTPYNRTWFHTNKLLVIYSFQQYLDPDLSDIYKTLNAQHVQVHAYTGDCLFHHFILDPSASR